MNNNWITYQIDKICNVEYGTRVVKRKDGGTIYPVYGGGGATFFMDIYNRKDRLTIARFAMSEQCVRFVDGKFFLNDSGITLSPKDNKKIDQRFLDYQCLSMNNLIYSLAKGSAQKNLDVPAFRKLTLKFPKDLITQKKIVAKLDKIFAEIDKSIAAVEANLINAEILFKSYLKKIFLLYGKNFKEYSIGDVCKIIGGGTPSKSNNQFYQGNIPWATVRDMNQEIIEKTQFKITNEAVTKSSTNVILKNNVIIATRVGLGKICIIKSDTAINQDLKAVIPLDSKVLEIYYLFYWFRSIANLIIEAGRGSTVNGVKLDFIKSLKIKIPNIDIQKNIINSINNIKHNVNYIILTNNKKIIELKLLKQSILQQAFNGELVKAA
jgi:type I restriction enzyme S subunit